MQLFPSIFKKNTNRTFPIFNILWSKLAVSASGTSMACPHAAGLVANFLSKNPDASNDEVKFYVYGTGIVNAINLRGTSGIPNLLMYSNCRN